jgi:ComEC/Rec2-related protein
MLRFMLPVSAVPLPLLWWVPVLLGCAWLVWGAWNGGLGLDLSTLLRVGGVGLLAWLALRRWSVLIVCAVLLAPLAWHFMAALPSAQSALAALAPGDEVRVEAVLRERREHRWGGVRTVRLLLTEAELRAGGKAYRLAELEVEVSARPAWPFRPGRKLRLAGLLREAGAVDHRVRLRLDPAEHAFDDRPWWPQGEAWRIRLHDRANYYLSKRAAAVFLPMVLDIRDRRAVESRDVAAQFRRVGVSHIFAISGMNVALIFGLLLAVQRFLLGRLQPGQGWVHAGEFARLFNVGLIWLYIALIGFPAPAVRAAIMGTVLVWQESQGVRTPPLYTLLITGLAMLAWSPGQLYDLSFQLSFMAFAFLVIALEIGGSGPAGDAQFRWRARARRWLWLGAMNVCVTAVVSLGLWPLIAARFGTFSWLVFAGNLLLVPVMGAVILPSALLALLAAAVHIGQPPGAWLERAMFGGVETALHAWLGMLRAVDRAGGGWVFQISFTWSTREVCAYYAALLLWLMILFRFLKRNKA